MPLQGRTRATAHGRHEICRIKTCTVARGLAAPRRPLAIFGVT
ncbi:hypothetical protein ABTY61_39770 [Kitasatospora sp. NPDC096128]